MNAYLETLGSRAKAAAAQLNKTSEKERSAALLAAADRLERSAEEILAANAEDVKRAEEKGVSAPMVDRLRLSGARIADIAAGLRQVAGLSSPVGETIYAYRKENGLLIEEKRVPFGVIGIIFESRPNVAADAFGLCFKTANAVILRGGSDAISSNAAVVNALRGIHEDEKVSRSAHSPRGRGADPQRYGKRLRARHRNGHGQLPYLRG